MLEELLLGLTPCISKERLESYRARGTDLEMLTNYLFNTILSESLYTSLCALEVSLRNSLDRALQEQHRNNRYWFEIKDRSGKALLRPKQLEQVDEVRDRILGKDRTLDRKGIPPHKIVSELSFGFWVSLLSGEYGEMWDLNKAQLLKTTFPHVPRRLRQRTKIYERYNRLRQLRNRVFHHESIWARPSLASDYEEIIEAISWISPHLATTTKLIDRFPEVHPTGKQTLNAMLCSQFGAAISSAQILERAR